MFNAPRRGGAPTLSSSAFMSSSNEPRASFDPLASSMPSSSNAFAEEDPWSNAPTPSLGTPKPDDVRNAPAEGYSIPTKLAAGLPGVSAREGLNAFLNDPPPLYVSLLDSLSPTSSRAIPLSSVHRLLSTSKLPAATIEKIISLTSRESSSLGRPEFFGTLALVALAQSSTNTELSIENLSAALPTLPLPILSPVGPNSPMPAAPAYSVAENGWGTSGLENGHSNLEVPPAPGALETDGADRAYWTNLEVIEVDLLPEKEGWFLQKYRVESDKRASGPVSRRYSDFVWLLDCLVKRYPFRLLPSLPPKRIGRELMTLNREREADKEVSQLMHTFWSNGGMYGPRRTSVEAHSRCRKALRRFVNMLVNHPVTRDDGALNVFLTEPNFEAWRKRTKVSIEEEGMSKRLNPAQEMAIPADLEEKLATLRENLPTLLDSYQKLVTFAERSLARLQAANADASRIALSLGTIKETMPKCCFRGVVRGCSLCEGVSRGVGYVGESWAKIAEQGESRSNALLTTSIEALKSQRDLYAAFRDLFIRHDKLSKDMVDSLQKKAEARNKKLEGLRSAQRPGWEIEVNKMVEATDADNATINSLLARRVFTRACMWHEFSLVLHSRQAAQATLGWREFTREEMEAHKGMMGTWEYLDQRLKGMPME